MNLVLDIGNTNVKLAVFDNDKMVDFQFLKEFSKSYLKRLILKNPTIKSICVSNSAQKINFIPSFCVEKNIKYLDISEISKLPIIIEYETPKTLGSDRIALAIGSLQYPGNKLIIDFGTCVTYDVVLENRYIGGQISPGLDTRLASLNHYTQKLPKLNLEYIDNHIGKNTHEAMLIGVCDSLFFELQNVIEKYQYRYNNMTIIITGGGSKFVKKRIKNINFINPYLLMEGLNYIIACNE